MSFVGVISENDDYEFIKKELSKNKKCSKVQLIYINKDSIENMKNVKFETIVICNDINKMQKKTETLDEILKNSQYLLINSDINFASNTFENNKIKIITYGMNQKATITASSIKEDEVFICLQRNIENIKSNIIEVQEFRRKAENITNNKVYNLLAAFALEKLYE